MMGITEYGVRSTGCGDAHRSDEAWCTSYYVALTEIVLIFAVFALQGAWPVPEVNEAYYLGKTIHYWNPDWLQGDFFMESADSHQVFYFSFGWLSLWLGPVALAWTGRIVTWLLLAWAWRRLSVAVIPRAWYSVLTAALFACFMERCHMAGEWVIGGVEAKGFAYVFVFLGLESLVRNRWNRSLLLFGVATAFHVLVGGWAALAAALAWLWLNKRGHSTFSSKSRMSPFPAWGILGGILLSLPGIVPALGLDWGVDRAIVHQAHQIYVFKRLAHHLVLTGIRPEFMVRLGLLWIFWLFLGWVSKQEGMAVDVCTANDPRPENRANRLTCRFVVQANINNVRRLRAFITGAVVITWIGVALHLLIPVDRVLAADLLRYYWFRLTDVALPLGVALEGIALVAGLSAGRMLPSPDQPSVGARKGAGGEGLDETVEPSAPSPHPNPLPEGEGTGRSRRFWLALAILVAAFHLSDMTIDRLTPRWPRSHQIPDYKAWREACQWIKDSEKIPSDARFLTPRLAQTFKWYTGHGDVAVWKDVPQNAEAIVQWWNRIQDIHATGRPQPPRWYKSPANQGVESLKQLGTKYQADYLITERTDPPLDLEMVFENRSYVIYHLQSVDE